MREFWVWFKTFVFILVRLILRQPPYWVFLFIATVFVIISLINQHHWTEIWAFFLYSAVGTLWRHAEKDVSSAYKEKIKLEKNEEKRKKQLNDLEIKRRWIYQSVNGALLIVLFVFFWVRG